jgi:hypothetical protein
MTRERLESVNPGAHWRTAKKLLLSCDFPGLGGFRMPGRSRDDARCSAAGVPKSAQARSRGDVGLWLAGRARGIWPRYVI